MKKLLLALLIGDLLLAVIRVVNEASYKVIRTFSSWQYSGLQVKNLDDFLELDFLFEDCPETVITTPSTEVTRGYFT